MMCVESTEVWFEDTYAVTLAGRTTTVPIDPIFLELVELGTLHVASLVAEAPMPVGASVRGSTIVLQAAAGVGGMRVSLTLRGTRCGRLGVRLPAFTPGQMRQNAEFWRKAYDGG